MANPADIAKSGADDDSYTMREAARLKGVSYHTVSRAIRSGKLPARRLGRMAFVAAPDLAAWRPKVERAPKKYRRTRPSEAAPTMVELAAGDQAALARKFAALVETLHVAALATPLPAFVELVSERLAAALDLRRVAIWGIDEEAGVVRRLASFGAPMSTLPAVVPLAEAVDFAGFVARDEAAVATAPELGRLPTFADRPVALLGVTSLFAAPLRIGDHVVGAVLGDRDGVPFALDATQLGFARAIATQAAVALEMAALRAALRARDGADR